MPKPKSITVANCPCCQHPEVANIDTLLMSGVARSEVARMFTGVTVRSVECHYRDHVSLSAEQVNDRVSNLESSAYGAMAVLGTGIDPKVDQFTWANELLINATQRAYEVAMLSGASRPLDVLAKYLEMNFKVSQVLNGQKEPTTLDVRVTLAVPKLLESEDSEDKTEDLS